MNRFLVACAALTVAGTPTALAQVSGQGGPIRVNADRSEVLERQRQVILIKDVDIMQGDARLRADKVTINYAASGDSETTGASGAGGFGDIETMTAEGSVFYVTPDLKATGTRGVYDAKADTITLTGEVVLVRGEDVATGEKLVMRLAEGRTTLDGGPGRVQMNINPGQGTPAPDEPSN
ncbi:LptA/OstA family protein [Henriciella litoralis]|uniref:LptA/OstA family protein n=1 Tax=Henriciella litoralis TaxID=568102 RepID=UPI0009FFD268|nr:LptA/OstA family protein [Henriciella litoralis]